MKFVKHFHVFILIIYIETTNAAEANPDVPRSSTAFGSESLTNADKKVICDNFCKSVFINKEGNYNSTCDKCTCDMDGNFLRGTHHDVLEDIQKPYRFQDVISRVMTKTQHCDLLCRANEMYFGIFVNGYCDCFEFLVLRSATKFNDFEPTNDDSDNELRCEHFCKNRSVGAREHRTFISYYIANIFRIKPVFSISWNYPCHCYAIESLTPTKIKYKEHTLMPPRPVNEVAAVTFKLSHTLCNIFCISVHFYKEGILCNDSCLCYASKYQSIKAHQTKAVPFHENNVLKAEFGESQNCMLSCRLNEDHEISDFSSIFGAYFLNTQMKPQCSCLSIERNFLNPEKSLMNFFAKTNLAQEHECRNFCSFRDDTKQLNSPFSAYCLGDFSMGLSYHACHCYSISNNLYIVDYDSYSISIKSNGDKDGHSHCKTFCLSIFLYTSSSFDEGSNKCQCHVDYRISQFKTDIESCSFETTFKWSQIRNQKLTRTQNCNITCKELCYNGQLFQFGVYYDAENGQMYCACFTIEYALTVIDELAIPEMTDDDLEFHMVKFYQTRKPDFIEETLCDNRCKSLSTMCTLFENNRGYYVPNIFQSIPLKIKGWNWPCHCFDITNAKKEHLTLYKEHSLKSSY